MTRWVSGRLSDRRYFVIPFSVLLSRRGEANVFGTTDTMFCISFPRYRNELTPVRFRLQAQQAGQTSLLMRKTRFSSQVMKVRSTKERRNDVESMLGGRSGLKRWKLGWRRRRRGRRGRRNRQTMCGAVMMKRYAYRPFISRCSYTSD